MTTLATANFNDLAPPAPTGKKATRWQADPPTSVPRNISSYGDNIGGVDTRTATSELVGRTSSGKLVTLNNSSAIAVTIGPVGLIQAVGVNAGGTGYSPGDAFTVNGPGTGGTGTVLTAPGGVVTAISIVTQGVNYAVSTANPTSSLGGGSGLTVDIFSVEKDVNDDLMFMVDNIGTGSAVVTPGEGDIDGNPTLTLGSNSGAIFYWDKDLLKWRTMPGIKTLPGGSDTQVEYNHAGNFGGITGATTDGTNLFVTTQTSSDNSTKAASTAFVQTAVGPLATKSGVQNESYTYAVDSGAANAYVATLSPAVTSYVAGLEVTFKAANANSGSSTLNVNGLGTKTIQKFSSGSLVNLASGDISVGQIMTVKYDGTVFQIVSGSGGGSSFTAGGDLSGSSSLQEVIGLLNTLFDSPGTAWADGQTIQFSSASGKLERLVDRPIFPVSGVGGKPSAGQLVGIYTAAAAFIFPANFATPNSYGSVGTNPTATATYSIYKNGTLIGNVVVSTSGVFTFTTVGGVSVTFNAGDRLTIVAPGSQDVTMADVGITLVGSRSATVPSTVVPPIFTWRGTYAGGTTYNPFDVVAYTVSSKVQSYVCISATTGNVPTNTSFWSLLAQAGADGANGTNGTVTPAQVQGENFIYAVDAGAANAFSVTLSPAPNVVDGSVCVFRAAHANTAASTLTLPGDTGATGGTAQSIVKQGGTALASGDVSANQVVVAVWDNTHTKWEAIGVGGGGGDLTAKYIIGATDALLTNALVWPALYNHPDAPPASPNVLDDEFDDASFNIGSTWTALNLGSLVASQSKSRLNLTCVSNGGSEGIHGYYKSLPAPPWEFTTKVTLRCLGGNSGGGGLLLYESVTGKVLLLYLINTAPWILFVRKWTNVTTYNSDLLSSSMFSSVEADLYLRIGRSGTALTYSVSSAHDGVNFDVFASDTITSFFTTAPDKIGLALNPVSKATGLSSDWFRRTV